MGKLPAELAGSSVLRVQELALAVRQRIKDVGDALALGDSCSAQASGGVISLQQDGLFLRRGQQLREGRVRLHRDLLW